MLALVTTSLGMPLALFDMLGGSELVVIFLLVLVLFGGEKMPEFARGLGKAIREFRKAASGVEQEFKRALEEEPTPPPANYSPNTIMPPAPVPPTNTVPAQPSDSATPTTSAPPATPPSPTPTNSETQHPDLTDDFHDR